MAQEDQALLDELTWFQKKIWMPLTDLDMWENVMWGAIKIALIVIVSRILLRILHKSINHVILKKRENSLSMNPRRTVTIGKLLKNVTTYVVNFVMLLMIISELNIVDLRPILAGAGVVGLAIGFGAQSLVKDVITGFFIIFEDQFAVGDVIEVGKFKGTVEMIGLRTTRIHSWTGEVFIIPNGLINEVTNFSLHNSLAIVDISIAYEANADEAMQLMKNEVERLKQENPNIVKTPEVLGVQMMTQSDVKIRVIAECMPNMQSAVARYLNGELKKVLDSHGIEVPYPRMVTYHRTEKGGEYHGT